MSHEDEISADRLSGRHYRMSVSKKDYEGSESIYAPRFLLIGIGRAGANYIGTLSSCGGKNVRTIAIANISEEAVTRADFTISLGTSKCRPGVRLADVVSGEAKKDVIDRKAVINSAIGQPDIVFLISAFEEEIVIETTRSAAEIARNEGALVILLAVISSPSEDKGNLAHATEKLSVLKGYVDSVFRIYAPGGEAEQNSATMVGFSREIDAHFTGIIQFVYDFMNRDGLGCIAFEDMKEGFLKGRVAEFAVGHARGNNGIEKAARRAMNIFMSHLSLEKTKGILVTIVGNKIEIGEAGRSIDLIRSHIAITNVFWRFYLEEKYEKNIVSIIMTGIEERKQGEI